VIGSWEILPVRPDWVGREDDKPSAVRGVRYYGCPSHSWMNETHCAAAAAVPHAVYVAVLVPHAVYVAVLVPHAVYVAVLVPNVVCAAVLVPNAVCAAVALPVVENVEAST